MYLTNFGGVVVLKAMIVNVHSDIFLGFSCKTNILGRVVLALKLVNDVARGTQKIIILIKAKSVQASKAISHSKHKFIGKTDFEGLNSDIYIYTEATSYYEDKKSRGTSWKKR